MVWLLSKGELTCPLCGTAISLDLLFLPLISADASSKSAEWWFSYSGLRGWSSKGHILKRFFTSIDPAGEGSVGVSRQDLRLPYQRCWGGTNSTPVPSPKTRHNQQASAEYASLSSIRTSHTPLRSPADKPMSPPRHVTQNPLSYSAIS